MKIAIITSGFDSLKPGGVSNVVMRIISNLRHHHDLEIVSFAHDRSDQNSIQLLNPKTYRNLKIEKSTYQGIPISRFGVLGSEFEILRYRKRNDLKPYFKKFDLIIVVTGILQAANIVPSLDIPVLIQCATRLQWERKSRYSEMKVSQRLVLQLQIPFLAYIEKKVLRSHSTFLVENQRMKSWLENHSKNETFLWYPGTSSPVLGLDSESTIDIEAPYISVGRFNEARKGWSRLFRAYHLAFKTDSSIPALSIIGWGDFSERDRRELEFAQTYSTINVHSNLSNEARDKQLRASSYFLQTSHEEGLGLAALEALSFGIPLICSETDGSREYVQDGVTGKLVPQGDDFVEDFSRAILESRSWNRTKMRDSCKQIFEKAFSEDRAKLDLLKILDNFRKV